MQINNLNLSQGEITAVENHLLFVGSGKGDKVGKLLTVNTDSDLSGVLAGADGLLAQVTAARDNGGQNWSASVMLYDAEGGGVASWSDAVDEAMELAKRMKAMTLTVYAKGGGAGRLFGSVTSQEIADALQAQGITLDKRKIVMDDPIKNVGTYTVRCKLGYEITAQLTVQIQERS